MTHNELLNANAANISVKDLLMSLTQMTETESTTPKYPIRKIIVEWIEHFKTDTDAKELSKSSLRNYESHVRNFSDWTESASVEEVTKSTIIEYRNYLHNTKRLKPTSVNTIIIGINQFFEYCVDMGYCDKNPTRKVSKIKQDQLRPRSLDDSTVNRLRNFIKLNCEKRNDNTHLMIFDFMLRLGLRVGEVISLKFEDIDLDGKFPIVTIRSGKGNKDRNVCMPDDLLETYKQYKANLHRSKNESQFIFMHHGQPYHDTAVRTFYFRLCKEHGVEHVSPHQLRHTFAVRKIQSGVPQTIVQSDMGHASFSTTARYAMPSIDDKSKFANY